MKIKKNNESWISVCCFYFCIGVYCILATVFTFVMAVWTLPSRVPELTGKFIRWCCDRF